MSIVTFYTDNVDPQVVEHQKKVFDHFGIPLKQIKPDNWQGHGGTIDNWLKENTDWDVLTIFDIDCIPLDGEVVEEVRRNAKVNVGIWSVAQKASHIPNSGIYASPAFITFSKETYDALGKPTFTCTERSDCAGELTYIAKERGVDVILLYPTHVEVPLWDLDNGQKFGKGTTYGNRIYHAFYSRKDNKDMFIKKCQEVCQS